MAKPGTITVPVEVQVDVLLAHTEEVHEGCREEVVRDGVPDKCWEPAEFLLWGKLFPPEALGPRCYDHAAKYCHYSMLGGLGLAQSAILDLRGLRRVR